MLLYREGKLHYLMQESGNDKERNITWKEKKGRERKVTKTKITYLKIKSWKGLKIDKKKKTYIKTTSYYLFIFFLYFFLFFSRRRETKCE